MTTSPSTRHSEIMAWVIVWVLAALPVLVVLVRVAAANTNQPSPEPQSVPTYIVSPLDGVFVAGPYRGAEPYVSVGSVIDAGTVVGNVEVWGRLHPVEAMVKGSVIEVLCVDDGMVAIGQPLFKIQLAPELPPT